MGAVSATAMILGLLHADPVHAAADPALVEALIAAPDLLDSALAKAGIALPAAERARLDAAARRGDAAAVAALVDPARGGARASTQVAAGINAGLLALAATGAVAGVAVAAGNSGGGSSTATDETPPTAEPPTAPVAPALPQCSDIANLGQLGACTPGGRTFDQAAANAMLSDAEFGFTNTSAVRRVAGATSSAALMKAHVAHGYGLTGEGITVGIFDSEFNLAHPDLKDTLTYVDGATTAGYPEQVSVEGYHGSNVSGLVVGDRNGTGVQGIAYGAKAFVSTDAPNYIGAPNADLSGLATNYPEYGRQMRWMADNGATVSSNSYGFPHEQKFTNPDFDPTMEPGPGNDPMFGNALSEEEQREYYIFYPNSTRREVGYDRFLKYKADENIDSGNAVHDNYRALAELMGGTQEDWLAIVSAMGHFQQANNGRGVIVWANSNLGTYLNGDAPPPTGSRTERVNGHEEVDTTAALPLLFPSLKGAYITVSNVVPNGVARAFLGGGYPEHLRSRSLKGGVDTGYFLISAPCGAAAEFCLSHDGGVVRSAGPGVDDPNDPNPQPATGPLYGEQLGTSQATPQVAGAVALLQQAFPNLGGTDIATRLFATADNTWFDIDGVATLPHGLSHGYSRMFGHGFIDLEAALRPIGKTTVTTAAEQAFDLTGTASRIKLSEAFGAGAGARLSQAGFIMGDVMNAGFATSVGAYTTDDTTAFADDMIEDWSRNDSTNTVFLGDSASFSLTRSEGFDARGNETLDTAWRFSAEIGGGITAHTGSGLGADAAFGFTADAPAPGRLVARDDGAFDNPLLSLADEEQYWAAVDHGQGRTFGAFVSSDEEDDYTSYGFVAQQRLAPAAGAELLLSGGLVLEEGGMLGTQTSGAFRNDESVSTFARVAGRVDLGAGFAMKGSYTLARTQADGADGVFTGFDPILSDTAALSIEKRGVMGAGDHAALTLSQPIRAMSGTARMLLPTGYDAAWNYTFSPVDVDLAPDARELRLTGSYATPLAPGIELDLGAAIIKDAGHIERDALDYGGFVGLRIEF